MNNVGKLLFLHFEKIIVAVFGAALLYSIIFHGPWIARENFSARLEQAVEKINSLPVRMGEEVPDDPQIVELIQTAYAAAPSLGALDKPHVWDILDRPNADFPPPTSVTAAGDRGYIMLSWQQNPNMVKVEAVKPLGVEVERATVGAEGALGSWQSVTRSANGMYYTPDELYAIAAKFAPQAAVLQKTAGGSTASVGKGYTVDDLLNAYHDEKITVTGIRRIVQAQIKNGSSSPEMSMEVVETLRGIGEAKQMIRRAMRGDPKAKPPTPAELQRLALESMGYGGGGKYEAGAAEAGETPAVAQPDKPAPVPVPDTLVTFDSIATFIDADVSPDQDYVYRVRFWTSNAADATPRPKATDWAPDSIAAAAKPDTEFLLSGISAEQGTASILVRKWVPATKQWVSQNYVISPGQEIGRIETHAGGNGKIEEIDFRTECVLLDLRRRPRTFQKQTRQVTTDPATMAKSSVDKVELWLYDTPQIVYSDRRGRLRIKWQAQAETS